MNGKNTKHLHESYPLLYDYPIYFECGDGWFDILDRLSSKIEKLLKEQKEKYPNDEIFPSVAQVKEKFGTLRFYITVAIDEIYNLIDEAEKESSKICEICGKEGKLNNGPWYQTLCYEHMYCVMNP
jgi:hypothetical protein